MFNIKEWKPSLQAATNWLENSIITLSGPAIAVSGIIAGIDLLTGGTMFKDITWLSLTWAICLLLTLDFQVLMLGAKAKRIYNVTGKDWKRKTLEIIVTVAIAAAISSVSVQMQSIIARSQATITYTDRSGQEHTRTLTIEEATRDMGINPVALIWERSALVLILIFISGWLRDEEGRRQDNQNQSQALAALDYNQIAQALAPLLAPQLAGLKTTIIAEIKPLIPAPVALDYHQLAQAITPHLPAPEKAEALDYHQLAQAIAPLLKPQFTEVRRVIIEEVKAAIPQLAAPAIEASSHSQEHRPAALPNKEAAAISAASDQRRSQDDQEELDAARDERLEEAYQELRNFNGGKRISGRQLAEHARANRKYCNEWLRERHPENETGTTGSRQDTEEFEALTLTGAVR